MGEARRRGNFEQRKNEAVEKRKQEDFIRKNNVVVAPVGSKRMLTTAAMMAVLGHSGVLGRGL